MKDSLTPGIEIEQTVTVTDDMAPPHLGRPPAGSRAERSARAVVG